MVPIFSFIKSHLLHAIIFVSFHLISTGSTVIAVDNNSRSQSLEQRGVFQESRNSAADFVLRRTSSAGQQCSLNQDMVWVPSSVEDESEFLNDADFLDLSGDGSVIATGRSYDDINIYQRKENNELIQLGQTLDVGTKMDWNSKKQGLGRHSFSFSFNGRIVAIGGFQRNGHHSVKMFEYNEETDSWNQLGQDVKGEKNTNDFLGGCVSMSDDGHTVAVGTRSESAKVYHLRNGIWRLKGPLLQDINDHFGEIVHLSGDGSILAICAKHFVKVFKFDVERQEWTKLGNTLGYFGSGSNWEKAVSMSRDGSTIAMTGTRLYTDELQVFRLNASSSDDVIRKDSGGAAVWEQIGKGIRVSSWYLVDFAFRLSGDGNILVVGDAENDDIAKNAGRVQVYQLQLLDDKKEGAVPTSSSAIKQDANWEQLGSDLFSIDTSHNSKDHLNAVQHWFGSSVAVSHDGQTVVASSGQHPASTTNRDITAYSRTRVFSLTCGGPSTSINTLFIVVALSVGGMLVAASIAVTYYLKRLLSPKNTKERHKSPKNDSDLDTTYHEYSLPCSQQTSDIK